MEFASWFSSTCFFSSWFICVLPGVLLKDIEASVVNPSFASEVCQVNELEAGHFAIVFVPQEIGIHRVNVRHCGKDIPGLQRLLLIWTQFITFVRTYNQHPSGFEQKIYKTWKFDSRTCRSMLLDFGSNTLTNRSGSTHFATLALACSWMSYRL